jgi:hypothetical protein
MNKQIEEILKEYHRNYAEYTQEAAMENNPTPEDILIEELSALIQKEREDSVREFVKELKSAISGLSVKLISKGETERADKVAWINILIDSILDNYLS